MQITEAYIEKTKKRLFNKIVKTNTCWNWTGGINHKGYGLFSIKHKMFLVHRVSFKLFKGEIPLKMQVNHSCDNPICINPKHLWLGTQQDNVNDMIKKGRARYAQGENVNTAKLRDFEVRKIRSLYSTGEFTYKELALKFDVEKSNIGMIIRNKTWKLCKS